MVDKVSITRKYFKSPARIAFEEKKTVEPFPLQAGFCVLQGHYFHPPALPLETSRNQNILSLIFVSGAD